MKQQLSFIAVLLITGCASQTYQTQASKQHQALITVLQDESAKQKACTTPIAEANPDIEKNWDSVFISSSNDPELIKKLSMDRHATEEEKTKLLKGRELLLPCRKTKLERMHDVHPLFGQYVSKWQIFMSKILLDLIQDKQTIAETNKKLLDAETERNLEWINLTTKIEQNLNQAHYAEYQTVQQQRARQSAALMQMGQQLQQQAHQEQMLQQQLMHQNRRRTINCNRYGNQVNCQSF